MAGTLPKGNKNSSLNGALVDINGSNLSSNGNGGNMFIFTAPSADGNGGYPGLKSQITSMNTQVAGFSAVAATLQQGGDIHFESPNTDTLTLSGTNKLSGNVPQQLSTYDGVLFWVDRRNSLVPYNADGTTNCPTDQSAACIKSAAQITEDHVANPCDHVCGGHVELKGPAGMNLNGVIYEPRGSLIEFRGDFTNQLQVIAGQFDFEDNAQVVFKTPTRTFTRSWVALIQ